MKKILVLAVIASALAGSPALARGHGIGVGANVLTGRGGVIGLLDGRGALVVNTAVTTGKGGCSAPCSAAAICWADCLAADAAATDLTNADGGASVRTPLLTRHGR